MIPKLSVADGKYIFFIPDGDWRVHIERFGQPLMVIESGHHAVAALVMELEELRGYVAEQQEAEEHQKRAFSLAAFFETRKAWSIETFGPAYIYKRVVAHIRKELLEIEAKPDDLEEWVDVALMAMDGAWRAAGADGDGFVAALLAKAAKNMKRTWPDWRTMNQDAPIEHVRSRELVDIAAGEPLFLPGGSDAFCETLADDMLHPDGRCDCRGEGTCAWCLAHCLGCGIRIDESCQECASRARAVGSP